MAVVVDWEAFGYKSGQATAERDGAYYDPLTGGIINGFGSEDGEASSEAWQARGAEIAPRIILALQPGRAQDAQFQADCQRFAEGFARGYTEALI